MTAPINKSYLGVGIMSGSSLDGIDLAAVKLHFSSDNTHPVQWKFLHTATFPLTTEWKQRLPSLPENNALQLAQAHADFGHFLGVTASHFIKKYHFIPDFIASHGHTIFHDPTKKMTCQIGDGAAIAQKTGILTIADFRTADIAAGGQGAPFSPLADFFLFPEYNLFLNIGGIANLTVKSTDNIIAFDVAPANQILNALAKERQLGFDEGGRIAMKGKIIPSLLSFLHKLPYFKTPPPKSLDNQWIQHIILPPFKNQDYPLEDRLYTACEFLAMEIGKSIRFSYPSLEQHKMLVTGGGAYNEFLTKRIAHHSPHSTEIVIPDASIVEFKEAALMALMGAFRLSGFTNTFQSVTGASAPSCGGALYAGVTLSFPQPSTPKIQS